MACNRYYEKIIVLRLKHDIHCFLDKQNYLYALNMFMHVRLRLYIHFRKAVNISYKASYLFYANKKSSLN